MEYFEKNIDTTIILSPTLSIPIGYANITSRRLIEDSSNQEDAIDVVDKLIVFYVKDTLKAQSAKDFISLDNQAFEITKNLATTVPTVSSSTTITIPNIIIDFDFEKDKGNKFKEIKIDTGKLNLSFSSDIKSKITGVLTYNSIIKEDGSALTQNLNLNKNETTTTINSNINAHLLKLNGLDSKSFNNFKITLDLEIELESGESLSSDDNINIKIDLLDLSFDYVLVDLEANKAIEIEEISTELDQFENITGGILKFQSPEINFTIRNSFNMPIVINFKEEHGIYSIDKDNNTLDLKSEEYIGVNIEINDGDVLSDKTISIDSTKISINKDNSNIADLITSRTSLFNVAPVIISDINDSSEDNLITKDSEMSIELEIKIPLDINIQDLEIVQELDFEFSEDLQNSSKIELKTIIDNGFPLGFNLKIEFKDINNKTLDSLEDVINISPATTSGDNNEVSKSISESFPISIDKDFIKNIKNATKTKLTLIFNTSESTDPDYYIKLLEGYEIDINMSFEITLDINE